MIKVDPARIAGVVETAAVTHPLGQYRAHPLGAVGTRAVERHSNEVYAPPLCLLGPAGQDWQLAHTRPAPGRPEVEHHRTPAMPLELLLQLDFANDTSALDRRLAAPLPPAPSAATDDLARPATPRQSSVTARTSRRQ